MSQTTNNITPDSLFRFDENVTEEERVELTNALRLIAETEIGQRVFEAIKIRTELEPEDYREYYEEHYALHGEEVPENIPVPDDTRVVISTQGIAGSEGGVNPNGEYFVVIDFEQVEQLAFLASDGETWIQHDIADYLMHEITHIADSEMQDRIGGDLNAENLAMDATEIFRIQRTDRNADEPVLMRGHYVNGANREYLHNITPEAMEEMRQLNEDWLRVYGGFPNVAETYDAIEERTYETPEHGLMDMDHLKNDGRDITHDVQEDSVITAPLQTPNVPDFDKVSDIVRR